MIGNEVGPYRILDRLGGGGMGVVYKAEDTRLGRIVALKFLSTELLSNESTRRRFLHEARAASSIDHPNVCPVYEVGEADGRTYMAMSYCQGRSLREVISAGPVPPREAFSIAFGIAQGLWAAHRRGIVHRDIKPANVLLTDDGFVRIVDFGLALLTGHSRVTTSGVTVGTVAYMSPEQTSGSDVAPNTDIWSLGVTLYEMLTGRLPFRGEINAALQYSIVHEPHTPLLEADSSLPPGCARIIDRCLEKDPAQRYQTIEELLEDMVRVARELGWDSSIASATIAPILNERRKRVLTRRIAIGVAAVAIAAGAVWAYREFIPEPSPYTTELRLAVMPMDNMIGAENEALVEGLSEHLSRVARWVNRSHPSMWTVPYVSVLNADLPGPTDAAEGFGANRVLTGDVQRFESGYRMNLRLVDTRSGNDLQTVAIPFDNGHMNALLDTLTTTAARIFDVTLDNAPSPWQCRDSEAATDYLNGIALLRRTDDKEALVQAVDALDRGASLDPSFASLVCADGTARFQLSKRNRDAALLGSALELAQAARAVSPGLTEAAILMGDVYTRMEIPDSAEAWYRRALTVEPGFLQASSRLENLCDGEQRIDEAERVYLNLTAVHPDLWVAHRGLGTFYFEHERLDDAAAAYRIALTLAPRDSRTLNNLGAVHHRHGEWSTARELFVRAFQTHPDCESSSNVAITLYFERKYADAARYYEFALEYCDTTEHLPWGDLARALYWAPGGRERAAVYFGKALTIARAALEKKPDDVDMMSFVIDYAAMVDRVDEAHTLIERIRPLLKNNEQAMYRVGATCEKLGQREAALDLLGNAVRHGFPVTEIEGDPMLRELVSDPRFVQMVRSEVAADEAQAAGKTP